MLDKIGSAIKLLKTRSYVTVSVILVVMCLIAGVLLSSSGNTITSSQVVPASDRPSIASAILWLFVVFIILYLLVKLSKSGGNGIQSDKEDPKSLKEYGTKWIDAAKGPSGLLIIWTGVLALSHFALSVTWSKMWTEWFNQQGLFWGFNLWFLAGIFFFRQRFQGTRFVSTVFWVFALVSIVNALPWERWEEDSQSTATSYAQGTSSPIEIVLEEWESWPDFEAPVGEYAYSKVPPGKKFDFDPLGKVYWTVEGSKRATLFTPGDPEPEYGTVWTRVGFMSLEEKPVLVLRKVEK